MLSPNEWTMPVLEVNYPLSVSTKLSVTPLLHREIRHLILADITVVHNAILLV